MRRLAACVAVLAIALAAASTAAAASWAKAHIRAAVESGLMGPSVTAFRPDDPLTRGELGQIVAGVTRREQVVAEPARPVTLTELDRALVRALGLGPAAEEVRAELARSALAPPRRAGWETVARLLALRFNHPAKKDDRELLPNDPATRAEAAFSVARLLALSSRDLERANELATGLDVPSLTEWQRRVLQRAVRFVGYPYVWGGMSESKQTLFGVTSRGGFDCSGFIWRVYKLEGWTGAPRLGTTIRTRTAAGMAGEVTGARRIGEARLQPGDVLFFGAGPRSAPSRITHSGISLGGGWFVHSSRYGTTLVPFDGWYDETFAWARRPLAEAGLR
jgi:cell wall-associated NlpC family hydrolase